MAQKHNWLTDTRKDAALIIINKNLAIEHQGKGNGFAWVELADCTIFSCYISPNVDAHTFDLFLMNLQSEARKHAKRLIIAGDFNAKSYLWTTKREDKRGKEMAEWLSQDNLAIINKPDHPTFQRYEQESVIDLTICSDNTTSYISNWYISAEETLSWHKAIYFDIASTIPKCDAKPLRRQRGWKISKENTPDFEVTLDTSLKRKKGRGTLINAEELTARVKDACNAVFQRKSGYTGTKKGVYWWNDQIGLLRRKCISARRDFVRTNRYGTTEEKQEKRQCFKEQRKTLKKAISTAKKDAWTKLLSELDQDIWGKGYKIITNKLKERKPLSNEIQEREAEILFPDIGATIWPAVIVENPITEFDKAELCTATEKLKDKKAAGPDNIPPEIAKATARSQPEIFLGIANTMIRERKFPKVWKKAKLVLLEKPKNNPNDKQTYRPLCLLNTMGKILEDMVVRRINDEVEANGGLHDRQYGFRKGRSTIQAMEEVQSIVTENTRKRNNRGFCILITIDVKNAFNTVKWQGIAEAMTNKNISQYLVELVKDYLQGREILVGDKASRCMTCGVPQGSKLGPLLWNINYDGVLRVQLPSGAALVGFADDLALVVTGWTEEELQAKADSAIVTTIEWLEKNGLQIAPHKTEAVLLAGRHTLRSMNVKMLDQTIATRKSVKYLGVHFDKDMCMREHIRITAEKADQVINRLARIMPNTNGPRASKRRVINSVVNSIVLYAAPIWAKATGVQKYVDMLVRVQRRMALRICSAYKTSSTPAAQLIAGIIPIDLLVEERVRIHDQGKEHIADIRKGTIDKWQLSWSNLQGKAEWSRRLIPNVRAWVHRGHGETNFHLTQMLTGHGCFQAYLFRFKRSNNDQCVYCNGRDTAEHTFFQCPRWSRHKFRLENHLETDLSPDNIVELMLANPRNWSNITTYVETILKNKESEERQRQKAANN